MLPCADSPTTPAEPRSRLDTCGFAVLAVLAFVAAAAPVTTNDLFWHVATGAHLMEVAAFPSRDVFSYTAGELPWFLHEWLTQVLFFGLHELGGMFALRAFTGLMAVSILFLVWRLARRLLRNPFAVLLVVFAFAILATSRFQTRPTLFSIAIFLGLVSWLGTHRGSWRVGHTAGLLVTTLAWINLHSVGLLALVVYGAFAAGHTARAWLAGERFGRRALGHAATWILAAGTACLNPSGLHIYGFAFQDKGEVMNFVVDEWGAFQLAFADNPLLSPEAYGVVLGILTVVVGVYLLTGLALNGETDRRRSPALPDPVHLAFLVMCLCGGLMARRFHWMLALSLLFALSHAATLIRNGHFRSVLRARVMQPVGMVLTLALLALHYHRDLRYEGRALHEAVCETQFFSRPIAPSLDLAGVRFLREAEIEGNAFCHYGSGGMLSYFLYPKVLVFVDSRADLYRREILLDFMAIRDGHPDQQKLLDRYRTDIYFRHWDIAPLRDPSGWARVWTGPDGEVWLRKHERNLSNLERSKAWHREFGNGTPAQPAKR